MFFIALFFLIPLGELMLLIEVGSVIGGWETIAICLLTAMVGGALARKQGIDVLMRMRASMHRGQLPAGELIDSVFIVVAGLMLMTPGFLTDSVGLLLLTPPVRAIIRPTILRRMVHAQSRPFSAGYGAYGNYNQSYSPVEPENEDYAENWNEPEFLPPGTVVQPPKKDDPPEIIVD